MEESNILLGIEKFAKGNKQTKNKLIKILIRQLSEQIQQLQSSLANKDWKEIKRLSHKMTSSFLLLKLERPIELTALLRNTAGTNIKITTKQLHELESICLQIIDGLKNIPEK